VWWYTNVIPAIQEVEVGGSLFQASPKQKCETKEKRHEDLSSNLNTAKKKRKKKKKRRHGSSGRVPACRGSTHTHTHTHRLYLVINN
jgi:hypothetical protein